MAEQLGMVSAKSALTGKTETIREAEAFGKYTVYTSNFNYANLGEEQE